VWCIVALAGCDPTAAVVTEIGDLRRQLDATAAKGITESAKWREEADNWRNGQGELAAAAADFMKNGIKAAEESAKRVVAQAKTEMTELAQDSNAELKLDADYIDARIRANFSALRTALDRYEAETKEGKKPLLTRFTGLLDELAKKQEVEPKTAISVPRDVNVLWLTPDKESGFSVERSNVSISGFGFLQPSVTSHLSAVLESEGETGETGETGKSLALKGVRVNSDFLVTVDLRRDDFQKVPDAKKLRLLWKGRDLHTVNIRWYRRPLEGPPNGEARLRLSWDGSRIKSVTPQMASYGMVPSYARLVHADGSYSAVTPTESFDLAGIGIRPDDQRLELKWEGDDVRASDSEKIVTFAKVNDPPYVKEVVLTVKTTKNDKDREIQFTYTLHAPGVGAAADPLSVGRGQVWDDNTQRSFRIVLQPEKMFTSNRRDFQLRVQYDSSDGDPDWWGRVAISGTLANGEPIDLLGEVPDFQMGHHDSGRITDRILREFPFDR